VRPCVMQAGLPRVQPAVRGEAEESLRLVSADVRRGLLDRVERAPGRLGRPSVGGDQGGTQPTRTMATRPARAARCSHLLGKRAEAQPSQCGMTARTTMATASRPPSSTRRQRGVVGRQARRLMRPPTAVPRGATPEAWCELESPRIDGDRHGETGGENDPATSRREEGTGISRTRLAADRARTVTERAGRKADGDRAACGGEKIEAFSSPAAQRR
jgi:hypothetical protein